MLDLTKFAFYREHFGKLLIALIGSMVVIVVLVVAFVVAKNQKVEREYFAVDTKTGRLTPIVALGQPFVSQQALLQWMGECVAGANSFDFVNYQRSFQQASTCFTPDGWEQFMAALEKAGTLATVKAQRLVVQGTQAGAAVITRQGVLNGVYTWQIEVPLLISYQGGQAGRGAINQNVIATVLVKRVATTESEQGVGIAQYVAREK